MTVSSWCSGVHPILARSGARFSISKHCWSSGTILEPYLDLARFSRIPCIDGLIDLSVRWIQPIQQQGRRFPSMSSETTLFTWSFRVVSCLTEMVQQIHSFRASGVIFSHAASALGDVASAFFISAGSLCTVPEDIFAVMFKLYMKILGWETGDSPHFTVHAQSWGRRSRTFIYTFKGCCPTVRRSPTSTHELCIFSS